MCLIDDSLVENVNSIANTLGWRAANYSEFWGRKYTEGLELRLGMHNTGKIHSIGPKAQWKLFDRC